MAASWTHDKPPDLSVKISKLPFLASWGKGAHHYDCGLLNPKNVCYVNSTLQALLHIPAFLNVFVTLSHVHKKSGTCPCKECLFCALKDVHQHMGAGNVLANKPILERIEVISQHLTLERQEDAFEFLESLLTALSEQELARVGPRSSIPFCTQATTEIHNIFSYWRRQAVICHGCLTTSYAYSNHLFLMIPPTEGSVQGGVTNTIFMAEDLCDFKCLKCHDLGKGPQNCSKTWKFHTFPSVLIVVVNRFGVVTRGNVHINIKDNAMVTLDANVVIGALRYSLRSAVLHHGEEKASGHFTTVVSCPNKSFVELDDHKVLVGAPKLKEHIESGAVYILLYELQDKVLELSDKRPHPPSPTKRSPAFKIFKSPLEKRVRSRDLAHLSPKKIFRNKKRLFSKSILKPKPTFVQDEILAQPLPYVLNMDTEDAPREILSSRRSGSLTAMLSSAASESSSCVLRRPHGGSADPGEVEQAEAAVRNDKLSQTVPENCEDPGTGGRKVLHRPIQMIDYLKSVRKVRPLVIRRTARTAPKVTQSQSSHEYSIIQDRSGNNNTAECLKDQGPALQTPLVVTVPGPHLPNPLVQLNLVKDLRDWLRSHGQVATGTKPVLIKRVNECIAQSRKSAVASSAQIGPTADMTSGNNLLENCRPSTTTPSAVPFYIEADIFMQTHDVPGSTLPDPVVENNTVRDLRRWLKCHGQRQEGNKTVLRSRVVECMRSANPPGIRKDVDKGEWMRKKADRMRIAYNLQCSQVTFPESGFQKFPSVDIPEGFNFGSVFHYLMETRPMLEADLDEDSGDSEVDEEVSVSNPFLHRRCEEYLRPKLLRRGLQYVKSNYVPVNKIVDCADDRCYYVKALIEASMETETYCVYITISKLTGGVLHATCGYPCPATANGRCSHVSAALLQILNHCHLNGRGCKYGILHAPATRTHGQTYHVNDVFAYARVSRLPFCPTCQLILYICDEIVLAKFL